MEQYERIEDLPKEKLQELVNIYAKNWLALDGLWFQSIEEKYGIDEAIFHERTGVAEVYRNQKQRRIKTFLDLPEHAESRD